MTPEIIINGTKLTDEQVIALTIALDKLYSEVLIRRDQEGEENMFEDYMVFTTSLINSCDEIFELMPKLDTP
jgi:hypothetical protein